MRRSFVALVFSLGLAGTVWAGSAYMTLFDFHQPGEFTVGIPARLDPSATHCPLLVHGFFGYTWLLQEQIDLVIEGIDIEVNGKVLRLSEGPHTFTLAGDESIVRKAGSGRVWWYRIFDLPIDLFPVGRASTVYVKVHRSGRSRVAHLPVPPVFNRPPGMRIDAGESPYPDERPGWYRFSIYRSAAPLPSFPGLYSGDTHVHTEYTHSLPEYGGPLEMYAAAAKASGLDWATFTDHASAFDSAENLADFNRSSTFPPFQPRHATSPTAKWDELVRRTRVLAAAPGRRFVPIVGAEVDVRVPSNEGHDDYFCHLLVYGHARPIPAEGANGLDWRIAGVTLKRGERGASGRGDVYGADTLSLEGLLTGLAQGRFGDLYGAESLVACLAHPINRQDRFKPNPFHMGVWWRWGFDDEPDELPALYAPAPGRLGVSAFEIFNGNTVPYSVEVDPSVPYWDSILAEGLRMRPPRRNAIIGGTDSHGDFTSSPVRDSVVALSALHFFRKPDGDGFGTVRTLAACPRGLTEAGVLAAIRDGQSVVTNGPALVVGVDRDGDGQLVVGRDALPSTREGDEVAVDGTGTLDLDLAWRSTEEFGPVEEVRLVLGRSTGPRVVWSARPAGVEGFEGTARVGLAVGDLPEWSYARAECVTRSGLDVVKHGRLLRRVERRAYTNPVWVHRRP
jgi:hypothetical protein